MRIGRRGWCFRRPPPKQQPKRSSSSSSSSFNTSNYYMMTKKSFTKPNYDFHVPGAPLNTTSYLIKSKGITTHHCHYQHQQQQHTTMKNNEYRLNDSLVLDGYGSMKGLIGLSSSLSILLNESEETGSAAAGESNSPSKQRVRDDRVLHGSKDPNNINGTSTLPPRLLSLRIMHRDDQIANLEDESMMMKERMNCIERELDQLKHRVKLLEEVAQNASMRTVVMIKDCSYCGDAVSVA